MSVFKEIIPLQSTVIAPYGQALVQRLHSTQLFVILSKLMALVGHISLQGSPISHLIRSEIISIGTLYIISLPKGVNS